MMRIGKYFRRYALPVLLAGFLLVAGGCTTTARGGYSNSKDYISSVFSRYMEGALTAEEIYDSELATISKSVISREDYLAQLQETLAGVTLSSAKIVSSESVEMAENRVPYNISKVTLDIAYTKDGEEHSVQEAVYALWQGSNIKLMYKNYLAKVTKEMTLTSDSNPVHCTAMDVYTLPQGTALGLHFQNDTADSYRFGDDSAGAAVSVTTDKTYRAVAAKPLTAAPGETVEIMVELPQTSGDIQRVLVSRFYLLAADGTASPSGDGLSYAMSIVAPTA